MLLYKKISIWASCLAFGVTISAAPMDNLADPATNPHDRSVDMVMEISDPEGTVDFQHFTEGGESTTPDSGTESMVTVSSAGEKILYLTFDDGPINGTQNVLKVLKEEGIEATMFCVGRHARKRPALFLQEKRMPNILVANHTYSHANGHYSRFYSNLWGVMSDVEHAQLLLGGRKYLRLAGRNVWRLPEIRRNDGALSQHRRSIEIPKYEELAKEGFYIYGWDVEWRFDHHSGRPLSDAVSLANRIEGVYRHHRSVQRNKVVLLAHDFMFRDPSSTEELRRFVRIMKRRGWSFRKIDHYSRSTPEPLHFAKYYGKPVRSLLTSIEKPLQHKDRRASDAYRPSDKSLSQFSPQRFSSTASSLEAQLVDAVQHYDARAVERLVSQGVRINQRDERGRLALNAAIRANSILLVKKLLNYGADLRRTDVQGMSALSTARSYRRTSIEKFLISYSLKRGVKHIVALEKKRNHLKPLDMLRQ